MSLNLARYRSISLDITQFRAKNVELFESKVWCRFGSRFGQYNHFRFPHSISLRNFVCFWNLPSMSLNLARYRSISLDITQFRAKNVELFESKVWCRFGSWFGQYSHFRFPHSISLTNFVCFWISVHCATMKRFWLLIFGEITNNKVAFKQDNFWANSSLVKILIPKAIVHAFLSVFWRTFKS